MEKLWSSSKRYKIQVIRVKGEYTRYEWKGNTRNIGEAETKENENEAEYRHREARERSSPCHTQR
jgi:hypothetical protein